MDWGGFVIIGRVGDKYDLLRYMRNIYEVDLNDMRHTDAIFGVL